MVIGESAYAMPPVPSSPNILGQGVTSLRAILQSFLKIIESYDKKIKDGEEDKYETEFQKLKQFSESLKSDRNHTCHEGEKTVNRKKNRYKDILPYDNTRVSLSDIADIPGSDYINASFIRGASGSTAYIACQGPLRHTVNDFWRMIVEKEVQVIVMACNEHESGKTKCENYWVEDKEQEREFGAVNVKFKVCRNVSSDFSVRTMKIQYTSRDGEKRERDVCQFHYFAWPDHGVPSKVKPLLEMVRLIRDCQTSETVPVLVHCSAGCGRTGTICAIDYVWGLLRLGKLTPDFTLFNLVREMRSQRIAMVQTKDQYMLVYRSVKDLFLEQLQIIDSHPYANVDLNGLPILRDSNTDATTNGDAPIYEVVEFQDRIRDQMDLSQAKTKDKELSYYATPKVLPEIPNQKPIKPFKPDGRVLSSDSGLGECGSNSLSRSSDDSVSGLHPTGNSNTEDSCHRDESQTDKSSPIVKSSGPTLTRKPSVGNRIISLFDKQAHSSGNRIEEKANPKPHKMVSLSRAKSDLSSRFSFRFPSSLKHLTQSINHDSSESRNKSFKSFIDDTEKSIEPKDKSKESSIKLKPPLKIKSSSLIKRSKSLKVAGKQELEMNRKFEDKSFSNNSKDGQKKPNVDHGIEDTSPIKVCVKQVEMPELQKPLSKNIKVDLLQLGPDGKAVKVSSAKKTFITNKGSESNGPVTSKLSTSTSNPSLKSTLLSQQEKKKTTRTVLNDPNSCVSEKLAATSRIPKPKEVISASASSKQNLAKNLELSRPNHAFRQYENVNTQKLDKLSNPGSLASFKNGSSNVSLSRSRSHVWRTDNKIIVKGLERGLSDEHINQAGSSEFLLPNKLQAEKDIASTQHNARCEKRECRDYESDPTLDDTMRSTASSGSRSELCDPTSSPLKYEQNCQNKPFNRPRMPKTNPYYSLNDFHHNRQSPKFSTVVSVNQSNSRHSGSDSSSNTTTPSSIPSTPTQSLDRLFSQNVNKNLVNGRENSPSRSKVFSRNSPSLGIQNCTNYSPKQMHGSPLREGTPPALVLKGSLSSTPSESEEKIDNFFPPHRTSVASIVKKFGGNASYGSLNPQLNALRLGVGNRERRSSFRKAVIKEAQPSINIISNSNNCPSSPEEIGFGVNSSVVQRSTNRGNRNECNNAGIGAINYGDRFLRETNRNIEHSLEASDFRSNHVSRALTDLQTSESLNEHRRKSSSPLLNSRKDNTSNSGRATPTGKRSPQINLGTSGLKYNRSLRAPSKLHHMQQSEQQSSLSCFPFKRSSSFESIADNLDECKIEEQSSGFPKETEQAGSYGNSNQTGFRARENEYVSLQSCRSFAQPGTNLLLESAHINYRSGKDYSGNPRREGAACVDRMRDPNGNGFSNEIQSYDFRGHPVPPPRTKRMQTVKGSGSCSYNEEWSNHVSEASHFHSNDMGRAGSSSKSNTFPSSDSVFSSKNSVAMSNHSNSSAPKSFIRALQHTAANVKNKFTSLTDNKNYDKEKSPKMVGNINSTAKRVTEDNAQSQSTFHVSMNSQYSTSDRVPILQHSYTSPRYLDIENENCVEEASSSINDEFLKRMDDGGSNAFRNPSAQYHSHNSPNYSSNNMNRPQSATSQSTKRQFQYL